MVGKLNSDAAAPTAAAAAGPRSGQALADQIVQRAREGGAHGEPDYVEVRASLVGRQQVSALAPLADPTRLPGPLAFPARFRSRHSGLAPACSPAGRGARLQGPGIRQVQAGDETGESGQPAGLLARRGGWRTLVEYIRLDAARPAGCRAAGCRPGMMATSVIIPLLLCPSSHKLRSRGARPSAARCDGALVAQPPVGLLPAAGSAAPPSSTPCTLQPVAQRVCAAGSPLPVGSRPSTTWPLGRTMWTPSAGSTPRRARCGRHKGGPGDCACRFKGCFALQCCATTAASMASYATPRSCGAEQAHHGAVQL